MHDDSSQIANILTPEVKQPLARDYHKENIQMMKQKEQDYQLKMSNQPLQPQL
jgi:hypothetical protein